MRPLRLRTATILCVLTLPVFGRNVHAEHNNCDVVQVGRIPDVIFPSGRPSCVRISNALIKKYGVSSNGLAGNDGIGARVLTGYPHVQIGGCNPSNQSYVSDISESNSSGKIYWGTDYIVLSSDGTAGSGTIELYSYDNGGPAEQNLDTPRNYWNYPIGYFSYFVTNSITDNAFTQTAASSNMGSRGNSTIISNPVIDGQATMTLTVTPVFNYAATGGVFNNHPIAAIYGYDTGNEWSIVNSDGGAMPEGAAFNVEFAPANPDNVFTTGNSSMYSETINTNPQVYTYPAFPDNPTLNLSTIIDYNNGGLLFPTSRDGLDPHPNGVLQFFGPSWAIANSDVSSMVASNFSVLTVGWPDLAGYIFNQSGGTGVSGNSMFFQRFSSSGLADPVASTHLFVAPVLAASNYLPSPLGVWWDGSEWAAFREDAQDMPASASINVYAHRPAFLASAVSSAFIPSPAKGDANGDRLSDFIMVGGPSEPDHRDRARAVQWRRHCRYER